MECQTLPGLTSWKKQKYNDVYQRLEQDANSWSEIQEHDGLRPCGS